LKTEQQGVLLLYPALLLTFVVNPKGSLCWLRNIYNHKGIRSVRDHKYFPWYSVSYSYRWKVNCVTHLTTFR